MAKNDKGKLDPASSTATGEQDLPETQTPTGTPPVDTNENIDTNAGTEDVKDPLMAILS